MATFTGTLTVLDPRAETGGESGDQGPAAGPLAGKRVGLRRDEFWGSWDIVTDVWAERLEADGVQVTVWRAPVVKGSEPSEEASRQFKEFLDSIDVAVTGLCNCGSCTLWAVHDGLAALNYGLPTGFVATAHFERLARVLTEQGGRSDIRITVLPYPLEGRSDDDVRKVADEHYDALLQSIGATV